MNALGIIIAANIAATFVIFCGLKLFDMGSDLAEIIRKYGAFLGIIFSFVAIFNFLLTDTLELIDNGNAVWIITAGMVAFAVLHYATIIVKHLLLKKKEIITKKKAKRTIAKSPAGLKVAGIGLIDVLIGVIVGAVAGLSFTLNNGTGIMVLCALILLQIVGKVSTIRQYQEANFTRGQNITVLACSLCASPIVSILLAIWSRENYRHVGVFMAVAVSYIAYLCLYHLVVIAKKFKKC